MLSNHRHIDNTPGDTPPWLKELRLRKRNKQLQQQLSNQSNSGSPSAESPQTSSSSPFFGASTSSSVTFGGVTTVQQPSSASGCHTAITNGGNNYNSCPGSSSSSSGDIRVVSAPGSEKCNSSSVNITNTNEKMVQERPWIDHTDQLIETIEKGEDSDSSEELKYGPGIVSKLKNRYLNLTLRETTSKTRPSILHLRKATSLEHILDDYDGNDEPSITTANNNMGNHHMHENKTERLFQRHNNNAKSTGGGRYNARMAARSDMKRARSVEIISNLDHDSLLTNTNDVKTKQRESLHEETTTQLIEGSGDKTCTTATDKQKSLQIEDNKNFSNSIGMRLNRPKRVQPMMDEKEKPQPDIVKEKKKLFERPELRTKPPQPTGEVAAKVAGFKNIIDSTKASNKKPPIKQKPHVEKPSKPDRPKVQIKREASVEKQVIGSPIPPLRSPIKEHHKEQTPPITLSPTSPSTIPDVSKVSSPYEEANGSLNSSLSETPDLIKHSSSHNHRIEQIETFIKAEKEHGIVQEKNRINLEKSKDFIDKKAENQKRIGSNSIIYSFSSPNKNKDHLPKIDNNRMEVKSPTREVSSPILEKTSPTKNKLSPTKERLSPNKEKLSPNEEKSSPVKEKSSSTKKTAPSPKKELYPPIPKSMPNHEKVKSNGSIVKELKNTTTNGTIHHLPSPKEEIVVKNSKQEVGNAVPSSEQLKVNHKDNNVELKVNKAINKQKLNDQSNLLKKPSQSSEKPVPQQKQIVKKNNDASPTEPKNNSKLSDKVIEKNLINKLNGSVTSSTSKSENGVVNVAREVPTLPRKKLTPKRDQQNSKVFDFTNRKDVPDYVGNDGSIKPKEKMRPKPGEGGIIILPGATIDESLVDDDEDDWKRLLECPPSPCNVTFTNDNVLIEGRSSLKKLRKPKMTIRFMDARPEIFEYPSENSLIEEPSSHSATTATNSSTLGHSVPSLSGSTLANYTPKTAFQVEEFQLGVTPSPQPVINTTSEPTQETENKTEDPVVLLQEAPMQFSAGTNSDMLF